MEYEIVKVKEKRILGIGAHLANDNPESMKKIGELWEQVFAQNLYENIGDKVTAYPICLYSDYEDTLVNGNVLAYDMTIGYEVLQVVDKKQWVEKIIPAGNYAKFTVRGNVTDTVGAAWQEIWEMPLNRSYTGDFEQYMNEDMENAEVEIYIALLD